MKKIKISLEALSPVFEKVEKISKAQRMMIYFGAITILIGAFVYFSYLPKYKTVDKLNQDYDKLEQQLASAKRNAMQLGKFRNNMKKAEKDYRRVTKALPQKQEIPDLLESISQAGKVVGLEFLLFQPKAEINKDFYAEIPVSIQVAGNYHNVGLFFDKVATLPRIVTIQAIKMTPLKGGDKLITSCSAVTYKFIDEAPPEKSGKKKK
ncbi:MAG: type 4a pilus biogenesis protein PilO [Thermodesulfobacteriota bacterium]|nr:type 4a pilus biogenesis protein PilO [Thermodesulfobacteriota bacterium]